MTVVDCELGLVQLLERLVHRALRAREGHAEGARGAAAAQGHPAAAAAAAALLRHQVGHRARVHLLR